MYVGASKCDLSNLVESSGVAGFLVLTVHWHLISSRFLLIQRVQARPLAQATTHSSEPEKIKLSSVKPDGTIAPSSGSQVSPTEDTLVVKSGTRKSKRLQNRVGSLIGMVLEAFPVL